MYQVGINKGISLLCLCADLGKIILAMLFALHNYGAPDVSGIVYGEMKSWIVEEAVAVCFQIGFQYLQGTFEKVLENVQMRENSISLIIVYTNSCMGLISRIYLFIYLDLLLTVGVLLQYCHIAADKTTQKSRVVHKWKVRTGAWMFIYSIQRQGSECVELYLFSPCMPP